MTERMRRFSVSLSIVAVGAAVILFIERPWLAFIPLGLWLGWLQVGSL